MVTEKSHNLIPFSPPPKYHYSIENFNARYYRVMLIHEVRYAYTPDIVSTVWGFISKKSNDIYRPINAKKVGEKVCKSDYDSMTEYSAMKRPRVIEPSGSSTPEPKQYSNTLEAILYAE